MLFPSKGSNKLHVEEISNAQNQNGASLRVGSPDSIATNNQKNKVYKISASISNSPDEYEHFMNSDLFPTHK